MTTVKTLPEVEQAIAQYQNHIRQLEKIIQSGTPQGRQAAQQKLAKVREDFELLLDQRERLAEAKGLSGFGQTADKKMISVWGIIGVIAAIGLVMSLG